MLRPIAMSAVSRTWSTGRSGGRSMSLYILACREQCVQAFTVAGQLSWNIVHTHALASARVLLARRDGVRVRGIDEHEWKHDGGAGASSLVTAVVDLTPIIGGY